MKFWIAFTVNLAGTTAIYSLMAFALARLRWRRRGVITVLLILITAGQFWIVPTLVPNLKDVNPVSYVIWLGNWVVSSFSVVILCQGVGRIPRGLEDSAHQDGCGWFDICRHIVLPFVRRELALIALLTAMATAPLFWISEITLTMPFPSWFSELFPLTVSGIVSMVTASSLLLTLPVILIFVVAQHWFLRTDRLAT